MMMERVSFSLISISFLIILLQTLSLFVILCQLVADCCTLGVTEWKPCQASVTSFNHSVFYLFFKKSPATIKKQEKDKEEEEQWPLVPGGKIVS